METKQALEELLHYHGMVFTNQQLNDYLWFFDGNPDYRQAIVRQWKKNNAPLSKFPSIAQLVIIKDEVALAHWNEIKKSQPTFREFAEKTSSRSVHGKEALLGIGGFLEGKMSKDQYIAWMKNMEIKHPGVGWQQQAESLEKRFNES